MTLLLSRHVHRAAPYLGEGQAASAIALAYRTAGEAGKSHDRAFHTAMIVYLEARPEEDVRVLAQG